MLILVLESQDIVQFGSLVNVDSRRANTERDPWVTPEHQSVGGHRQASATREGSSAVRRARRQRGNVEGLKLSRLTCRIRRSFCGYELHCTICRYCTFRGFDGLSTRRRDRNVGPKGPHRGCANGAPGLRADRPEIVTTLARPVVCGESNTCSDRPTRQSVRIVRVR